MSTLKELSSNREGGQKMALFMMHYSIARLQMQARRN